MILSHYNKDHIGSAATLLEGFAVGTVLRPAHTEESAEYEALLRRSAPCWAAATVLSSEDVAPELAAQLEELVAALLYTSDGTVCIR